MSMSQKILVISCLLGVSLYGMEDNNNGAREERIFKELSNENLARTAIIEGTADELASHGIVKEKLSDYIQFLLNNNIDGIRALLEQKKLDVTEADELLYIPLAYAALLPSVEAVSLLLQYDADPLYRYETGSKTIKELVEERLTMKLDEDQETKYKSILRLFSFSRIGKMSLGLE
jgi:hypothetical protein